MLVDGRCVDRLHRVLEMRQSDVPLERERGEREMRALMRAVPSRLDQTIDGTLRDALYQAAGQVPFLRPSHKPDTRWTNRSTSGRAHFCRRGGRVLVVRQSACPSEHSFYVVVDGIHISGLEGAPMGYPDLMTAMEVAVQVAQGVRPGPMPGLTSGSGYQPPGPQWQDDAATVDTLTSTP
jgi:hypothetical protein